MAIKKIKSENILNNIIKSLLREGEVLSADTIEEEFNKQTNNVNLSIPELDSASYGVSYKENTTATKWNETNHFIFEDLNTAYEALLAITNKTVLSLDRWRNTCSKLSNRLQNLDARITNLVTTQTSRSSKFINENFIDLSNIDSLHSTCFVDIQDNNVQLSPLNNSATRLNLNYLTADKVSFAVLSNNNLQSTINATNSDILNAFDDTSSYWQARVLATSPTQPITVELKINISDTPVEISKISITLHSTNSNSAIQITPLLSNDGVNFTQIQSTNITSTISANGYWIFPATKVTYVKLIMTKTAYDSLENQSYIYEFGAEDISFYDVGYNNTSQILQTLNLYTQDLNGIIIPFSNVELQTCESIPGNTNIKYSIAVSNSLTNPNPNWVPVDPVNRDNAIYPKQISFVDGQVFDFRDIKISYNSLGGAGYVNPAATYSLVESTNNSIGLNSTTSTNIRYITTNDNDRLLSLEIDTVLPINLNNIQLFRNVGHSQDKTLVRGVQRGWTYEEPYYKAVILVKNPIGIAINTGSQAIIIDSVSQIGNTLIPVGAHSVAIHKSNWLNIHAGITTLSDLKNADSLFPYNQKLLIEGIQLLDINNPYVGVDIFAGYLLNEIMVTDFDTIIKPDDYSAFAIDKDIPDNTSKSSPSYVFVVKSDQNNSDFLNELFALNFTVNNIQYKYIMLQAELTSSDPGVTPIIDSYSLKLST